MSLHAHDVLEVVYEELLKNKSSQARALIDIIDMYYREKHAYLPVTADAEIAFDQIRRAVRRTSAEKSLSVSRRFGLDIEFEKTHG